MPSNNSLLRDLPSTGETNAQPDIATSLPTGARESDSPPNYLTLAFKRPAAVRSTGGDAATPLRVTEVTGDQEVNDLPNSPALTIPDLGAAPELAMLAATDADVLVDPIEPIKDVTKSSAVTRLPAGWTLTGDLISENDVLLSCKIEGDILCTSPVASITLTDACVSKGDITGRDILLQGHHTGRVDATSGRVCIEPSARISGAMTYTHIKMNGGLHNISLNYVDAEPGLPETRV